MDAIKRIELRFGSIQKPHAAGIAGIINQVMKPIGPQRRQRLLKGADKPVKGVGFAGAEGQRDRPRALSFNPRDLASGVLTEVLADFRPAPAALPALSQQPAALCPGTGIYRLGDGADEGALAQQASGRLK
jgi:hypothetical protein